MKNLLTQFSIADIRQANKMMKAQNASSGRFTTGEIKLKAGGKTKVISTKVNRSEISEAWAKVIRK